MRCEITWYVTSCDCEFITSLYVGGRRTLLSLSRHAHVKHPVTWEREHHVIDSKRIFWNAIDSILPVFFSISVGSFQDHSRYKWTWLPTRWRSRDQQLTRTGDVIQTAKPGKRTRDDGTDWPDRVSECAVWHAAPRAMFRQSSRNLLDVQ